MSTRRKPPPAVDLALLRRAGRRAAQVEPVRADLSARGLGLVPPRGAADGMRQLYPHAPDRDTLCFQIPA